MQIKVNEMFGPTIQGEGKTAGKEVLFLRLVGCNLQCIWCDTPHTWNWEGTSFAHPEKFNRESETIAMSPEDILEELRKLGDLKSLVISGGEPLIQQKALVPLLTLLREDDWWIEIETNGTITPTDEIVALTDQFNCSPKLRNSENSRSSRIVRGAMEKFAKMDNTYFKFVISGVDDIPEIREYIKNFKLNKYRVFLMPLGKTREELGMTSLRTASLAEELGLMYSDRLHIDMFGGKRGV